MGSQLGSEHPSPNLDEPVSLLIPRWHITQALYQLHLGFIIGPPVPIPPLVYVILEPYLSIYCDVLHVACTICTYMYIMNWGFQAYV